MYGLTLTSAPAEEPVSLAELKAWLRVDHSAHDVPVAAIGAAARDYVEKRIGRQLVLATYRLTLDGFPWPGGWNYLTNPAVFPDPHTIRLPKAPLQSVSSVEYFDLAGTLQTLAASTYDVDATTDPGRVQLAMNKVWPVTLLRPGAVRITYVAGYGAASAVPEMLKAAIKMLALFWYEPSRGDNLQATAGAPAAVEALLGASWNGELEYGLP